MAEKRAKKKATRSGGSFQEELLWLAATMSINIYIGGIWGKLNTF